ncbi:flavin reductase family protein [Mucilaginibacter ginsenosidivorans]|uniref:Flavin reductase family protein n=1 Tax=Mucilaginibacter ginsenosidivorans TaxID=398053 RepID=A0A5B8UZ91_9SPHI|nr:flavin reductase family protein [Mucilaginibacter ginsenosidivorans]QEC63923.1 flavin reductase family protein [Mucilaginibacter ginsenosidivorans]
MLTATDNKTYRTIRPKILYFGTPVALITTLDESGNANIGPMSSVWALGYKLVLGLGCNGKTFSNLLNQKECVVNMPSAHLHENIERIARLTGAYPVPDSKKALYTYEKDKFSAGGFTKMDSQTVRPPAIAGCPLQLEAILDNYTVLEYDENGDPGTAAVTVEVINVKAHEDIITGTDHINPEKWSPLIYNFRHYYALGEHLGKTFKAEV